MPYDSNDPTDWRVREWQAKHLGSTPHLCATDPVRCRLAWELVLVFAPTQTLKAQLLRTQVTFALGERDAACQRYDELAQAHPESIEVANNVGICRVRDGDVAAARAQFERATHLRAFEGTSHAAEANLHALDAWMRAFKAEHGDREPAPGELSKFVGTIIW